MTKEFCLLHFISQEPYIIGFWFKVHMCKRIIYPGFCYIFSNFLIFGVNSGSKEQKMAWNDSYVCRTPYLSKHTSCDVFCYTGLKWWHLQMFFHFFKILVFWVVRGWGRGVTGQEMAQNHKKFCLTPYLGNCTSYDCVFWCTCVK